MIKSHRGSITIVFQPQPTPTRLHSCAVGVRVALPGPYYTDDRVVLLSTSYWGRLDSTVLCLSAASLVDSMANRPARALGYNSVIGILATARSDDIHIMFACYSYPVAAKCMVEWDPNADAFLVG